MKTLVLSLFLVAQSVVAASQSSSEIVMQEFKATPKITIHRENAAREGISAFEIDKQIQAFFESHERFTFDELKDLGIKTVNGRIVRLSQIASVEVSLRKDSPERPAEQAAPSNGDKPSN